MPPQQIIQVEALRSDVQTSRLTSRPVPSLSPGEVLVSVELFALTANNISYAVTGDSLGYWRFYPCEEPWGVIPVWGFAKIQDSRMDGLEVGETIWGFLPMASYAVLQPGSLSPRGFIDAALHRDGLAEVYNRFLRTRTDPPELNGREMERCALIPVFTTSFIVDDFLADNNWFGAVQVLILSASSKTGFALADLVHRRGNRVRVIGATSARNQDFVQQLGVCDHVISYDEIEELDPRAATVVVDMAGSSELLARTHRHFGERLVYSCLVGATHWSDRGRPKDLPGATPKFFFAPGQIAKREQEWGAGEVRRRAQVEALRIADATAHLRTVEWLRGPEACREALADQAGGRVPPDRVLMLGMTARE